MFGFGTKKILGVDIGSSSIKVVEVKFQGGKPFLTNYAWMKITGTKNIENTASLPDEFLAICLKRLIKEGNFETKKANLAIPASGGLVTLIEFPQSIEEDLAQAIKFEAHKYIPSALEDVVFSWDIVGRKNGSQLIVNKKEVKKKEAEAEENKKKEGKLEVLLVAASKNKVEKYEKIAQAAGIEIESIEIESFSLIRSLLGNDQRNFLVIDIGHRICNIILSEKGIIKINRNIDAGGRDLTRIVASNMNLDDKRAEQTKKATNFFQENSSINFPPLEIIANEANRVLDNYYGENNRAKLDAVIISGGTSNLKGIDDYFAKMIKAKVYSANPFSRLSLAESNKSLVEKIKSSFAVAVGLAIREENKK